MTRKAYAALMTGREQSKAIAELCDSVLHQKGGMTRAYGAIKEIDALVKKYNADFGDVVPNWRPPQKTTDNAAPVAAAAPQLAIAYEMDPGQTY